MSMTYDDSGVNYADMDPFKLAAQKAARETDGNLPKHTGESFRAFAPSRGESAFLVKGPGYFLAHVEEGLGTKNVVADEMYALTGRSYYDHVAQCTMATFINDLITVGALPLSAAMHVAAGNSDWFNDQRRAQDLVNGWKHGCDLAECIWGGGESSTLRDIVNPSTVVLSGSATGIVAPESRLVTEAEIMQGDIIVMIESSGIHANGLTLARDLAKKLPEGYLTKLPTGRTYGETLLDPTHIYARLVRKCMESSVEIHYMVNVTGHGWRKLMRSRRPFTYVINTLPTSLPIFEFMQEHGPISNIEAYGNFNMGAGFALYVPQTEVATVCGIADEVGLRAFLAGHVENGPKKVVVKPKGLEFAGETLAVR